MPLPADSIQIRKAVDGDLVAVLALYSQKDLDDGKILELEDARKLFAKFRDYPDYDLYVAVDGDRVVGTFELLIMHNLAHLGRPSGVVEDVVVSSDCRSRGVGRRMMRHAMDVCRERGCYKMALSSNAIRTDAHRFYDNLGFRRHGYSFVVGF